MAPKNKKQTQGTHEDPLAQPGVPSPQPHEDSPTMKEPPIGTPEEAGVTSMEASTPDSESGGDHDLGDHPPADAQPPGPSSTDTKPSAKPVKLKLVTPFAVHAKGSAVKIATLLAESMKVVTAFYKVTPEQQIIIEGLSLLMVKLARANHPRHSFLVSLAWDPIGGDLRTDFKVFEFACPDNYPSMAHFERDTEQKDAEVAKDDDKAESALKAIDNMIRGMFPASFED